MSQPPSTPRQIIRLSGERPGQFLQGLITNDMAGVERDGIVYAAMLTPQGKYLADFFVLRDGEDVLIDIAAPLAEDLRKRLMMYRLRARIEIEPDPMAVARGTGPAPTGAVPDPRHPSLGWRHYGSDAAEDGSDWDTLRVAAVVPETGIELIPSETFILEAGFDRLNGVDFRKGCYVGQEVTARMRHKTELRKGLVQVTIDGSAPAGTPVMAGDRQAGTLYTRAGGLAIAHLRFDRATGPMQAGGATLTWSGAVPGQQP